MDMVMVITVLSYLLVGAASETPSKRFVGTRTFPTLKYGDRIPPPYQYDPPTKPTNNPPAYKYIVPSPNPTISPPSYTYNNPPDDTYIVPTPRPSITYTYNPPTEAYIAPTPRPSINPPSYTYNPPTESYMVPTPNPSVNPPTNMYLNPPTNPVTNTPLNPPTNTYLNPINPSTKPFVIPPTNYLPPTISPPTNTYLNPTNPPTKPFVIPSTNYLPPTISPPANTYIKPPVSRFPTHSFQQTLDYGRDGNDYYPLPNYQYSLKVSAPEYGTQFGHQEARQGEVVQGRYYVLLPDGRIQVVEYVADEDGYRSKIDYQDGGGGGREVYQPQY